MTGNEYPTEEQLKELNGFDVVHRLRDFLELLEELWNTDYGNFELTGKKVKKLKLVTGGWSGNEDVVRGMPFMFNDLYWQQSIRGGVHIYKIKEIKK